ncbi:tetratricopeptide repeat protein [Aequorivita sublithincola DSM 14238]|uniref:Tetratricopeptide repeat protein n=1 Tax=Aequorivita sublithincola (strain DSM 14238 / LMG 21431 / ACAM 643 / 9-3) TaxID=746697 RepID=I3YUE3_AEQSU|nr:tetratricopeptide repeat protein [Aequorivita sublithincola]AFL80611.1 tetratricopeptide repeat protein [Aequorivita sublithincola DSM 14238]
MISEIKNRKSLFIRAFLLVLLLSSITAFAQPQQAKEQKKELKAAQNFLSEAQQSLQKDKFPAAEADYRKAIFLNPKSETAKYNLGTAYYGKEKNAEAMLRFQQAATTATDKAEKHKAFHNLGNTFMNEKKYTEAVEAYKNALRNNPNDDETRYNLALAKDMLDKNPPPPEDKDDKDKKDQDKKDQDKKDQQDKQDKKDQGDKGDQKADKDKGDDKQDKKEGDKDKDQGKPKDEEGDKPQQQQPVPGQLSPQQVKSLLEAMNNEEKKTQDKINAEKQKGAKVKSDKDW